MASIPNPDDVFRHPLIKAIDSLWANQPQSMDDVFREINSQRSEGQHTPLASAANAPAGRVGKTGHPDSPLVECRICGEFVNEDEFRCKDTDCPLEES